VNPACETSSARAGAAETQVRLDAIRALVALIPDPEIPVVTLEDLGILRAVRIQDGLPTVVLTPTYSGCPATEAIRASVRNALDDAGFADAQVLTELSPPWTTDWIGPDARRKLREYGIAPPACIAGAPADTPAVAVALPMPTRAKPALDPVCCPRCGDARVEQLSRWGSTPCKAHYRCLACREPFDYFKPY
jgi:ring-1,2-phenylacetyl-CoA epoxidase subunit PaaD